MTLIDSRQPFRFLGLLSLLFLVPCALFFPAREFSFQFDDAIFLEDENVQQGGFGAVLEAPQTRILTWLSFLVQYRIHGPSPGAFHLLNLFLHGLNAILVFLLLLSFLTSEAAPEQSTQLIAFYGALVFALHPLQTEPVLYIYQRSTLLAALFAFLALLFHRNERYLASFLCFLLALFSKEYAVAVPVVLWLNDGLFEQRWKPRWNVVTALAGGSVTALAWVATSQLFPAGTGLPGSLIYSTTQVTAIWHYLALTIAPVRLNIDHDLKAVQTLDLFWWTCLSGLVFLFWLLLRFRNRYPHFTFFSLTYFCFLLPTSSLVPRLDFFFEHRIYASIFAFSGLLALLIQRLTLSRTRKVLWGVAVACGLLLGSYVRTDWTRLWEWQNQITLWKSSVENSPEKYRPNYNYGVALMDADPELALNYFNRAIQINPDLPQAFRSIGEVYKNLNRDSEALQNWEEAVKLNPDDVEIHLALGELYSRRRDYLNARSHLARAQEIDARDWRPYFQLAQLNLSFGFLQQTIIQSQLGLNLNPDHLGLRLLLADSMSRTENWERAFELYSELLVASPQDSTIYFRVARTQWKRGDRNGALRTLETGFRFAATELEIKMGQELRREIQEGSLEPEGSTGGEPRRP